MLDDAEEGVCVDGEPVVETSNVSTLMDRPWAVALTASTVLAGCGGGGGANEGGAPSGPAPNVNTNVDPPTQPGSLAPLTTTATAAGYQHPRAQSDAEAARFLMQAQFSASYAEIAAVRSKGYLSWLAEQLDAPKLQSAWEWADSKPYGAASVDNMVWRQLMGSSDPVRQRMALALSEIFVVSATPIASDWPSHMMAHYWDILVAGVTGNFRNLLEEVTLCHPMGLYLGSLGNQKEDAQGRQPDENYAREIMQLFTIGLYQLNADGSIQYAADGSPLYSYTQADVSQLARVFTGYGYNISAQEWGAFTVPGTNVRIAANAWTRRQMLFNPERHSMLEAKFLGTFVPASTAGQEALRMALDTLFNHPNVGPFIGRQLIQRLVTSNPSPGYVARVATIFSDNGAGVRGDMKSVFAAVLLDNEARDAQGLRDPNFGRLREPMVRLVQWARTFGVNSVPDQWRIGSMNESPAWFGQSPLRAPSVFNFFRPGYVPPSIAIARAGMVAPEFQIVNEVSVSGYLNVMEYVLFNGPNVGDMVASYAAEAALALDPAGLVKHLDLLLSANQLDDATQLLITNALSQPKLDAASSDQAKRLRICAAVLLVMAAPEYLVQK